MEREGMEHLGIGSTKKLPFGNGTYLWKKQKNTHFSTMTCKLSTNMQFYIANHIRFTRVCVDPRVLKVCRSNGNGQTQYISRAYLTSIDLEKMSDKSKHNIQEKCGENQN